jgi:hypothetical protein
MPPCSLAPLSFVYRRIPIGTTEQASAAWHRIHTRLADGGRAERAAPRRDARTRGARAGQWRGGPLAGGRATRSREARGRPGRPGAGVVRRSGPRSTACSRASAPHPSCESFSWLRAPAQAAWPRLGGGAEPGEDLTAWKALALARGGPLCAFVERTAVHTSNLSETVYWFHKALIAHWVYITQGEGLRPAVLDLALERAADGPDRESWRPPLSAAPGSLRSGTGAGHGAALRVSARWATPPLGTR